MNYVSLDAAENARGAHTAWQKPKPLPNGLRPVAAFDPEMIPASISPWVMDISARMQCPPDFVAASAMTGLGSVLGRKIGIRPQRRTDWLEVPTLWACIVGRPGAMKTPAMAEALKPIHRLEAQARELNEEAAAAHAVELEAYEIRRGEAQKRAKKAAESGADLVGLLSIAAPQEPPARRYVVNDASYEALGVVLGDNPNGVLAFRDELVSLLRTLDREDSAAARGFFLTAWSGTSGYTFDRIMRGRTHIEAACMSLLGSTQPGRLSEYMRKAISGGAGDDGLIQRFGLLVWPDQSPEWADVDRYPDSAAREAAWDAFTRLDALDPVAAGAESDQFEAIPFLRFDEAAQALFGEWRSGLEARLRSQELHPALESHLSKYRKLLPALCLINHLADGGTGPIGEVSLLRAQSYAEYLETHAQRAYSAGSEVEAQAARAILSRIRRGDLEDNFSARDVQRHEWSNLSDREQIQAGLDLLADLDWLVPVNVPTGGRPKTIYRINPEARR